MNYRISNSADGHFGGRAYKLAKTRAARVVQAAANADPFLRGEDILQKAARAADISPWDLVAVIAERCWVPDRLKFMAEARKVLAEHHGASKKRKSLCERCKGALADISDAFAPREMAHG